MAKITVTTCDVKPCNNNADREFHINGRTIHVCGEGCYTKYWSREYQIWKEFPYELQATYTATMHHAGSSRLVLKLVSNSRSVPNL